MKRLMILLLLSPVLLYSAWVAWGMRTPYPAPIPSGPVPVLVIESDGWRVPQVDIERLCRPLRDAGHPLYFTRHRETPTDTIQDLVADIAGAAELTRRRSGDARLVLIGFSAGGHLALLAAPRCHATAVVAWAPPTDLRDWEPPARARFGRTSDPASSPICCLTGMPPVLLIHGTADQDVPVEQSRAYADASGCELVEIAGGDHYFNGAASPKAWAATVAWLGAF